MFYVQSNRMCKLKTKYYHYIMWIKINKKYPGRSFRASETTMKRSPSFALFYSVFPGRSFQQSDLIGSVPDSNRNPTKLDENFINLRNPIGFLVAIRHPDP